MFIENGLHTTWYDIAVRIIKAVRTRGKCKIYIKFSSNLTQIQIFEVARRSVIARLTAAMTVLAAYYRVFDSLTRSVDRDRSAIIREFYPLNMPE
ncbi:hypothetical protein ALC60_00272 [Trachymyrmex zeteki]|uniref:Uncharacterized protein n=1 Tax=Mycetomoellerius zeteki TaxID=64791 RepID=A0A151XJY3_9HYME|nr:hypothetical protein ALC60_00272 [Trachymyrmex zeteki]